MNSQIPTDTFQPRRPRAVPTLSIASNSLERLAHLMHGIERLLADLATSRSRIADARAYLDSPDCKLAFGEAHLDRCRAKHSGILAQLRANRIEASQLLGEGPSAD